MTRALQASWLRGITYADIGFYSPLEVSRRRAAAGTVTSTGRDGGDLARAGSASCLRCFGDGA